MPNSDNVAYVQIDHVDGAFLGEQHKQPDPHHRTVNWTQLLPAPVTITVTVSAIYTRKHPPQLVNPFIRWLWPLDSTFSNDQYLQAFTGKGFSGKSKSFDLKLSPVSLNEVSTLQLQFFDGNAPQNDSGKYMWFDSLNMVVHAYDYNKLAKELIDEGLKHTKL